MLLKIATWNVNSIRKRIYQLCDFIINYKIDVVLIQEIRCTEKQFPYKEIEKLGYECVIYGESSRNGVCIISKYSILEKSKINIVIDCQEARYIECKLKYKNHKIRLGNVYVPNGKDVNSYAFIYKLRFLFNLRKRMNFLLKNEELIIVAGDYNVAPNIIDVFDPVLLNNKICFHIKEREQLRSILNLGFKDAFSISNPEVQQFTWWKYQGNSFKKNYGMRIDHIFLSPQAVDVLKTCYIDSYFRRLKNSSDHAPVICILDF